MAQATRNRDPTVLSLCDSIMEQVEKTDFDVAIIGASGLGIPLAARIRKLNKVAISIDSQLQILFGVIGRSWRERESWQERYFNEFWINVPQKHFIPEKNDMVEGGAYWRRLEQHERTTTQYR